MRELKPTVYIQRRIPGRDGLFGIRDGPVLSEAYIFRGEYLVEMGCLESEMGQYYPRRIL